MPLPVNDLRRIATTIRGLSIDAIEAANSGHPGLPLGCAELGAYLYGYFLNHNPLNPHWLNRDRFVLSAGHGSMLLYSCLHLAGFGLSLNDLRHFRKLDSPTAGHPEFGEVPGVETTTGPLGQGLATAVGIALGHKMAAAQYHLESLLTAQVVVLAGDGCMMEGVSSEASSLAGHLRLNNLIVIYDANAICLDGEIIECFTENVAARYHAYGWRVLTIDGHDFEAIDMAMSTARAYAAGPVLIIATTVIGKGSPSYAGTSEVHGKALGSEEARRTKEGLGLDPAQTFFVPESVTAYFQNRLTQQSNQETAWNDAFSAWQRQNPEASQNLAIALKKDIHSELEATLLKLELKPGAATRQLSGDILQVLHDQLPYLIGGSADLSCSDNTWMKKGGRVSFDNWNARNIKYGVREFAMAAISSGLYLQGLFLPYCGTFLTFSDYMRNAIRLAALMQLPVIYQFTHDSILLGEDGPTHQPVEHLASLRAMPNLVVIRPADGNEVKGAWIAALKSAYPTALILSRQGLPSLQDTRPDGVARGAYILKREHTSRPNVTIMATGSEVHLALKVAETLTSQSLSVRVISFPSFELFETQDSTYQATVLGGELGLCVSIEAQTSFGWHRYVGKDGLTVSVDSFGLSAPASDLAQHFGFTSDAIVTRILSRLNP